MGITNVILTVRKHRKSQKSAEVAFLVDSGSIYSLVPGKTLEDLEIEPYKTVSFSLADGTTISRKVGDAYFEYNNEGGAAPVIFGEDEDIPQIGITTLNTIGLVLNPFTRTFHPMKMRI